MLGRFASNEFRAFFDRRVDIGGPLIAAFNNVGPSEHPSIVYGLFRCCGLRLVSFDPIDHFIQALDIRLTLSKLRFCFSEIQAALFRRFEPVLRIANISASVVIGLAGLNKLVARFHIVRFEFGG